MLYDLCYIYVYLFNVYFFQQVLWWCCRQNFFGKSPSPADRPVDGSNLRRGRCLLLVVHIPNMEKKNTSSQSTWDLICYIVSRRVQCSKYWLRSWFRVCLEKEKLVNSNNFVGRTTWLSFCLCSLHFLLSCRFYKQTVEVSPSNRPRVSSRLLWAERKKQYRFPPTTTPCILEAPFFGGCRTPGVGKAHLWMGFVFHADAGSARDWANGSHENSLSEGGGLQKKVGGI